MTITTKIEPIDRDIALLLQNDLSPEARRATLANYANEQLAEAQAINKRAIGRVPDHETIVDGARGARVEQVRPDGVIVFEFELLTDLFAWIGEQLIQASPSLTGEYRRSHAFFAGGVEVDPGEVLPDADEYVFVSTSPYAGKIERGQSDQTPDGVYQVVAALASRRFGNSVRIRFTYRTLDGARYPAIVITTR